MYFWLVFDDLIRKEAGNSVEKLKRKIAKHVLPYMKKCQQAMQCKGDADSNAPVRDMM